METRDLYKAKRTDNGEWVQGFYFCMTYPDGRHTHHFIMPIGADLSIGTPIEKIQIEVDPSTICRCTGLNKEGKLVWENDLIKDLFSDVVAPIKFGSYQNCFDRRESEHIGFYVNWPDTEKSNNRKDLGYWIHKVDAKLVGNVFDNWERKEKVCSRSGLD